jgi:hypothetical protein
MSLIDRAKNILMQPKQEWPVIDAEPATVGQLYSSYIIPLSAIPVIAGLIGMSVFGLPFIGRMSLSYGLGRAVLSYVLSLVAVYIVALIIDGLAPTFNGTKNRIQALKVAAYSYTASWVAGILQLIPALSIIAALLGLYGIYLLYTGLPVLMKAPEDKALGYTVVTIIAVIILWFIIGAIVAAVIGSMFGLGAMGPHM